MENRTMNNASFFVEQKRSMIKRPFVVMPKCVGPVCNLDCDYCYYIEKENLYPQLRFNVSSFKMPLNVLEKLVVSHIAAQPGDEVQFVWHGGEPTLLGIEYFKEILKIQTKYAKGKKIQNVFQTNGVLIDREWSIFLKDNDFLCGVSIDGPEKMHNAYRKYKNGRGAWKDTVRGIGFLKEQNVDFNIMAVVNAVNVKQPILVYDYLKRLGSRFIQFTPIVERIALDNESELSLVSSLYKKSTVLMDGSVGSVEWGNFLCRIFDMWVKNDVGYIFVNYFDNLLAAYIGEDPSLCSMAKYCCCSPAIEHNGDVYTCDHYVFPENYVGNILKDELEELVKSDKQLLFEEEKFNTLPKKCVVCEFLKMCGGDCPKNRINVTEDGERISYLCEGYRLFFQYSRPYFEFMANELFANRAPANVMLHIDEIKSGVLGNYFQR